MTSGFLALSLVIPFYLKLSGDGVIPSLSEGFLWLFGAGMVMLGGGFSVFNECFEKTISLYRQPVLQSGTIVRNIDGFLSF